MKQNKNIVNELYYNRYKASNKSSRFYYDLFFSDVSGKILDVGCSTGNFLAHCSKDSEGIDYDKAQLMVARYRGLKVKKCDLNTERFPFKDNTFDAVNAMSVIEHLKDSRNCMSEIRRVLKKGGKFVAITPNLLYWKFKFWDFFDHYTPFTRIRLKDLCKNAGFSDIKIHYYTFNVTGLGVLYRLGATKQILKAYLLLYSFFVKQELIVEGYK